MNVSDFKDKEVILFYKNKEEDAENPTVVILDEVKGFGLHVEFDSGIREVVAFSELAGWRETNQE